MSRNIATELLKKDSQEEQEEQKDPQEIADNEMRAWLGEDPELRRLGGNGLSSVMGFSIVTISLFWDPFRRK